MYCCNKMPGAASFLERKGLISSVLVVQGSELVRAIRLLVRTAVWHMVTETLK